MGHTFEDKEIAVLRAEISVLFMNWQEVQAKWYLKCQVEQFFENLE